MPARSKRPSPVLRFIPAARAATLAVTTAQAIAFESAHIALTAPTGSTVEVSDTATHLHALTAAQIAGLPGIGVSELYSTNANVSYATAQTAAIVSSGLSVAAAGSDTVTENFADGDYSVFQGGALIQQKTVNTDGSFDVAYFDLTGVGYSSYEDLYNASGAKVADAQDLTNGSGNLIFYGSGLTVSEFIGARCRHDGSGYLCDQCSCRRGDRHHWQDRRRVRLRPGLWSERDHGVSRDRRDARCHSVQPVDVQQPELDHDAGAGRLDATLRGGPGTGKTAAFALPILHQLAASPRPPVRKGCRVLVLSPTRELSGQILDSFRAYGRHLRLRSALAIGGVSMGAQVRSLLNGVDIMVATPGRLLDLVQSNALRLGDVEFFVLDEADRMLDMGFIQDIRKIVAKLPKSGRP